MNHKIFDKNIVIIVYMFNDNKNIDNKIVILLIFQVSCPKLCLHRNFVLLAKSLKETKINLQQTAIGISPAACTNSINTKDSSIPVHIKNAIKIQTLKEIPYEIPSQILYSYYTLPMKYNDRLVFEPEEEICQLCQSKLGGSIFPQGCRTMDGNGYLITNVHSFLKVDIKVKRCTNKECKAVHVAFPYNKGDFFCLQISCLL